MNNRYIYIIISILSVCMIACSDNELVGDGYEETPVRIRPVIKEGIEYDITTTRSTGPFEKWSDDPSHWLNANFRTFALLDHNRVYDGARDYSKSDIEIYNQLMRIKNANGELKFYDENGQEEEKYYSPWRTRRYNFFTYFTDAPDTFKLDGKSEPGVLKTNITINGRQDVMHGFAYHTDQELTNLISQMPNNDETKLFTNGNDGRDYLYSGMAGNRGIHPQFHLKHLLSRFDLKVQGVPTGKNNEKKYSYLQVIINEVNIKAPAKGTLYIARSNWQDEASYNQAADNGEILTWEGEKKYNLEVIQQDMQNVSVVDVDFNSLQQQLLDNGIVSRTQPYFHVNSEEPKDMCLPVMLPAMTESVEIELKYTYVLYYYDTESQQWKVNLELTKGKQEHSIHKLSLPVEQRPFKPGSKYTIWMKIYGREEVSIDVLNGEIWEQAGTIDWQTED